MDEDKEVEFVTPREPDHDNSRGDRMREMHSHFESFDAEEPEPEDVEVEEDDDGVDDEDLVT